ncbi:hypothetical protein [Klebsiella variicola]
MTKSTITREQLEEWVAQFDEDGGCDATDRQLEALIRQSLAAMDSEPVGTLSVRHMSYSGKKIGNQFGFVHSDAAMTIAEGDYPLYRHAQPAPEYPETLPCPVLLEPGLRFGKGIKTSTVLAALARRAVYESDMTALSPEERAEFQAGIEGFKALIAQPAPVVPDGYVMVPVDLLSELRDWAHPEIEKYCEMWKGRRDSEFPALRKVIADVDALLAAAQQDGK